MATHNSLFAEKDVRRTDDGLAVSVQLPWYRSLWLSAVDDVAVTVNGVTVPKDDIRFSLEGREYRVDELPQQSETLWFVADRPDVLIHLDAPPAAGDVYPLPPARARSDRRSFQPPVAAIFNTQA